MTPSFDLVVPTLGRPSLATLLAALAHARGPLPGRVLVVDDSGRGRNGGAGAESLVTDCYLGRLGGRVFVLRGRCAGPAAARNIGWRASRAEWIAFLDDDVVPRADWLERLAADLSGLAVDVAGSQGRLHVPLPSGRAPPDWERNVKGLEGAR